MNKKLNKNVSLIMLGEETEIDKNLIEQISDPIMHVVRNSIDHGIESDQTSQSSGKEAGGTVTLEAKDEGAN